MVGDKGLNLGRIVRGLFWESKGLKLEIALVFLIPGFIYFLAGDLRFSHSLSIDRSLMALITMVIMMLWFIYRRVAELQREIAQRQEIELMLKEIEERYRALFDRSLDLVFVHGFNGKFLDANNVMLDCLGYTREELLSFSFLDLLPDDEKELAKQVQAEIIKTSQQKEIAQFRIRRKDGEYVDIEVAASTVVQWGKPYAIQGVALNISERVKAGENLLSMNEKLRQAVDRIRTSQEQLLQSEKLAAVGQLISGVAHELNNPLMAISGYAEMFSHSIKDETERRYVLSLNKQSERAIGIVRNLLSFARKQEAENIPISVNEVINSVVALRIYELKLDNINVETDLYPNLPPVIGDFQRLQQVFLNLLINSEQAFDESVNDRKVSIRTELIDGKVEIHFSDNGSGFPKICRDEFSNPSLLPRRLARELASG